MSSSNLTFDPLRNPTTISSLQTMARIFETCIGPTGRLKLIENTRTLSSSSQRLIHHISVKNSISKIVVSTAKNQLKSFNDGGLFCALLTLKLIFAATTGTSQSLPLIGTLYDIFAKDFLCLLKESSSLEVDFSNLDHLKSVVLTVLSSKPGCLLSRFDREHICSILLKAFLDSIPTNGKLPKVIDSFRFVSIDGLPTIKSRLLKGALVQIPETDKKTFIKELHQKGQIKVALFTCSLAGDVDWPVESLETTSLDLVVESVMRLLDNLVLKLVSDKVNLLLCQKVVHPRVKKRLQKAGIPFIDRLGTETAKCIQYISGGNCIASLSCELSYGTVPFVSIEHLGRNSFLLLGNDEVPLFTILLTHYNEESSAELKVVCRQALDSLLRILRCPKVCFGGGCSEIRTALCLAKKVKSKIDAVKREAFCTSGQVLESLNTFLRAVASISVAIHKSKVLDFVTENSHGHLWKLHDGHFPIAGSKCQCGSHDSASIDPLSWSLLTDISNLYGFFPLTTKSSEKISAKVSPSTFVPVIKKEETKIGTSVTPSSTVTSFSLEVGLHSSTEDIKPNVVSPNSFAGDFCSPSSFNLSADCFSPSKSMPSQSNLDVLLSASFSSTPSNLNPIQFVSAQSVADSFPILPKTISNNSELVPQHFRKINNPVTVPFIVPVPIPSKSFSREFQASLLSPTSKSNDSVLLDELTCKTNSLSLAFETASLLLRTTVCINNLPA